MKSFKESSEKITTEAESWNALRYDDRQKLSQGLSTVGVLQCICETAGSQNSLSTAKHHLTLTNPAHVLTRQYLVDLWAEQLTMNLMFQTTAFREEVLTTNYFHTHNLASAWC